MTILSQSTARLLETKGFPLWNPKFIEVWISFEFADEDVRTNFSKCFAERLQS